MVLVVFSFLLLGIPNAAYGIPVLLSLNESLIYTHHYSEEQAHDISSAIFLFSGSLGDAIGPILGGYLTYCTDFEFSCLIIGLLNLGYFFFMLFLNKEELIDRLHYLKEFYFNKIDCETYEKHFEKQLLLNENDKESLYKETITEKNLGEMLKKNQLKNKNQRNGRSTSSLLYMVYVNKNDNEENVKGFKAFRDYREKMKTSKLLNIPYSIGQGSDFK